MSQEEYRKYKMLFKIGKAAFKTVLHENHKLKSMEETRYKVTFCDESNLASASTTQNRRLNSPKKE